MIKPGLNCEAVAASAWVTSNAAMPVAAMMSALTVASARKNRNFTFFMMHPLIIESTNGSSRVTGGQEEIADLSQSPSRCEWLLVSHATKLVSHSNCESDERGQRHDNDCKRLPQSTVLEKKTVMSQCILDKEILPDAVCCSYRQKLNCPVNPRVDASFRSTPRLLRMFRIRRF